MSEYSFILLFHQDSYTTGYRKWQARSGNPQLRREGVCATPHFLPARMKLPFSSVISCAIFADSKPVGLKGCGAQGDNFPFLRSLWVEGG
jgi:hypothetical protein